MPYAPAGATKLARMAGEGIEAAGDARKAPADSAAKMVDGNGAAPGQAVADRGSKQAPEIGKPADSGKRTVGENKAQGDAFEVTGDEALQNSGYTELRPQLRIRTDSGKLRIPDRNATAPNGKKVNIEMKSSDKARYPKSQREADKEIAETGGTIESKGPDKGKRLPPTPTKVVRPCDIGADGKCR
jgi:hypothetical protein